MKYEISEEVLTRLKEIYAYNFTQYHKERAEKILNSIDEVFQKAANNPNFYPPYLNNTYPNRNLRRAIIHKTYVLIFEVLESHIHILSLYHGAMDKD